MHRAKTLSSGLTAVLRSVTGAQRTTVGNRRLGLVLCFVAGATNAGGFLAIGQYTSHMTGIVSAMADHLVLGNLVLVLGGLAAVMAFVFGAASAAVLVNWARRMRLQSEVALPLLLEAALLLAFGLLGRELSEYAWWRVPATVLVLCYVMGLQNALITKVSRAEIRTTHVTGIVTDLGIELGKWCYWNWGVDDEPVRADRRRMGLLGALLVMFLLGGVAGAFGFSSFGFVATVPLAGILVLLAWVPLWDDVVASRRRLP